MRERKRDLPLNSDEKRIIKWIANGLNGYEMAKKLNITPQALRARCTRIYIKTGAVNRPHLVNWAYQNNILGEQE